MGLPQVHKNTLLIHLGFLQHFCLPLFKLINSLELASLLQDPGRTVWKSIFSSKISGEGGGGLYESWDFAHNILCNVTAARTKSIAVSGDKHVRAKNNLNMHDKIPNAFSVTLRYLDAR